MAIQVAFYKGQTRLFNRAVSWWLDSPYSHCEIVLATEDDGYSFCIGSSFQDGGVRAKYIKLDPAKWDIVDVPFPVAERFVYAWAKEHEDDKYDTWGLLGHVWRRGSGDRSKRTCAQASAEMLGYPDAWRFDPAVLHAALTRLEGWPV